MIFIIFAQIIDCGYVLDLPQVPTIYVLDQNKENRYMYPVNPSFTI